MKELPQNVSESTRKRNPHLYSAPAEHDPRKAFTLDTPPPKRIRQSTKPLMNKLEGEFQVWYEKLTGHTLFPQAMRFRLGNGIWYKPDFILSCPTMGMAAFEVKGPHAFRGGFENLKVAATTYRFITWYLVWKDNGAWQQQNVLP